MSTLAEYYNWLVNVPGWIILGLVFFSGCIFIWCLFGIPLVRGFFASGSGFETVSKAATIIAIIAGLIGIFLGIIQIGVFFGWWPERL